jgi:hypothetical protein
VSQIPSIDRARREIGWAPTPYATWLERTVRWYRDVYRAGPAPQYAHREKELEILAAWEAAHRS